MEVRERYLKDPVFHHVVDSLRVLISVCQLTPSEVREATMLACIIEEALEPRPPLSTSDEELETLRQRINSPTR